MNIPCFAGMDSLNLKVLSPVMNISRALFLFLLFPFAAQGQSTFWTEDFNNGCSANCYADGYTSTNGRWTTEDMGTQGNIANQWYVSCAENGQPLGQCGAPCAGNPTLHVGEVSTGTCPTGDCGATYSYIASSPGMDCTTDRRAISPVINTTGRTGIILYIEYIHTGHQLLDHCYIEFSYDAGTTWFTLVNLPQTPGTFCPVGRGLWYASTTFLPSVCDNNPNFRLAFRWVNNADGIGENPSFAVDNMQLRSNTTSQLAANFTSSSSNSCDTTCVSVTDQSSGSPISWDWYCPGAITPVQSGQNPPPFCFTSSGLYDIRLIVRDANFSDTITRQVNVNVQAAPVVAFNASAVQVCEGNCINFSNLVTGTYTSMTWNFPGGNPAVSTAENPQNVCYATSGVYNVTLTANNAGCTVSHTESGYILVLQPMVPVVSVSGNTLSSTPALTYQWYSTVSGIITGATQQNFTPGTAGDYYVVVTDFNGCSATSPPVFINPLAAITASFTTNTAGSCDTVCVSLSDQSTGNPVSWEWSSPGALNPNQSGSSPPPFCYTSSGSYNIRLIASNGVTSDTLIQGVSVTVIQTPVAGFTANDTVFCPGSCISFSDQSAGTPATWNWTFPGANPASATGSSPSNICYSTPGMYDVSLTVSHSGCSNTMTHTAFITVFTPQVPVLSVSGNSITSTLAQSYQWYETVSGILTGAVQQTFTATQPGNYYVITTDANGCTAQSLPVTISFSNPVAAFVTSVNAACDTACMVLTDQSSGSPQSWTWSCPGAVNPAATGQNPPPFCFVSSGTYNVTLVVSSAGGSDTLSQQVMVNLLPLPQIQFSCTDSVLCPGTCTSFSDLTQGAALSWSWIFSGAIPDTSTVQHPAAVCYPLPGTFPVTLQVSNGTCTATRSILNFVQVVQPDTPSISLNNDQLTASPASSWQWYSLSAGSLTGATQQTFDVTETGSYFVQVTDSNGCLSFSDTLFVFVNSILEFEKGRITAYPNPFHAVMEISSSGLSPGNLGVEVRDVQGKLLMQTEEKCNSSFRLNLEGYPAGLYFVRISRGSLYGMLRMMKQ